MARHRPGNRTRAERRCDWPCGERRGHHARRQVSRPRHGHRSGDVDRGYNRACRRRLCRLLFACAPRDAARSDQRSPLRLIPGGPMSRSRRPLIAVLVLIVAVGAVAATLAARAERQAQATTASSQRVLTALKAFLATLDSAQRAKVSIALDGRSRTVWSNLPTGIAM